jgi:hypothetical protein
MLYRQYYSILINARGAPLAFARYFYFILKEAHLTFKQENVFKLSFNKIA